MVFRVVKEYVDYNYYNDTMISEVSNQSIREKHMRKTRSKLYDSTDLPKYHELLKNKN